MLTPAKGRERGKGSEGIRWHSQLLPLALWFQKALFIKKEKKKERRKAERKLREGKLLSSY